MNDVLVLIFTFVAGVVSGASGVIYVVSREFSPFR